MDKQFEHYYHQVRSKQKRDALMWSGLFMLLYLTSGYFAEFSLAKVISSAPHFFDYLADTVPVLKWDVLFDGRDANGHAVEGSLIYWGYRLPIQLPLLWETFCVAIAATVVSAIVATFLAFFAANNTYAPAGVRWAIRSFVAFLRTMPELAWAVMFVMAYGVGALPGFIALALHTVGSLTKLFYEAIETVSMEPVRGLRACGGNRWENVRFGIWPQVKPIIMSYSFLRLEVNFRSSTILGLVGAGGIGQELMTNIKLDRYDQVSMTLLLIIIVVSLLDSISGYLRQKVLGES
ncbi:MAG: phosphonate ABC transporter, permease protein PhnE [Vibrio litoralis]|uniref:phosphonate ABC transporter, permease protein PhnE n=1 Tax=Vibrio litoralis TaxID=335972 RepID=UPI003F992674